MLLCFSTCWMNFVKILHKIGYTSDWRLTEILLDYSMRLSNQQLNVHWTDWVNFTIAHSFSKLIQLCDWCADWQSCECECSATDTLFLHQRRTRKWCSNCRLLKRSLGNRQQSINKERPPQKVNNNQLMFALGLCMCVSLLCIIRCGAGD